MALKLYVCGTRGSFPTFGKKYEDYGQATTCYVLREDDYAILLDCGTGIVNAVPALKGCKKVDVILSHVHYDHIMGLFIIPEPCPEAEVCFYGNFDAWTAVSNKGKGGSHTFWPETIKKHKRVSVKPGEKYKLSNGLTASFVPSTHGDGAMMTMLERKGRSICFTGDYETMPDRIIEDWAKGTDLLIYDGSYAPEEYPGHEGWGHSTWLQACEIAKSGGIRHLMITHYANTHDDVSLAEEEARAKEVFDGVGFAREGMCYTLENGDITDGYEFLKMEDSGDGQPLPAPEPVKVRAKVREEELKKIAYTGWLRGRSYVAAVFNWLILLISSACIYDMAHRYGDAISSSAPFILLVMIAVISVPMSIFDLTSVDRKEGSFLGRPHWASVALLLETAAASVLFLSPFVFWVPKEGLAALVNGSWPGGIFTWLVIPALVAAEYYMLEARAEISVADMVVVLCILLALHSFTCLLGPINGLSGILHDAYCESPRNLIYILLYEGCAVLVYFINQILIKAGLGYRRVSKNGYQVKKQKGNRLFRDERSRQILYLAVNALLAVSSLIYVISFVVVNGLAKVTYLVLVAVVLFIIGALSVFYNARAIAGNSVSVYPVWYKFLSYTRLAGTLILAFLFLTAWLQSGWGFAASLLINPATVLLFIICPLATVVTFFMESHEYDMNSAIYTGLLLFVIFMASLIIVRMSPVLEEEISTSVSMFYTGNKIYFAILAQTVLVVIIYIIDRIYIENARFYAGEVVVERDPDGVVQLLIAGARGGVAPTRPEYYHFGQASNCYCIRDGSYGMILDCGSGLIYAPEFLKGCTDVDVFLSDTRFSTVMGLLAAPNPCPGAKIRFFGPFGRGMNFENMNGFATPPLWPVNVIVGECISATPDKDIRLNNLYSVRFQLVPRESGHYVLRLSGALGVCYTGPLDYPISKEDEWAKDCDLLICDGRHDVKEAVDLANRSGVSHVLIANHKSFADDAALSEEEKKGQELCSILTYARQGTVYTIN